MKPVELGPEPIPVPVSKERSELLFLVEAGARVREARLRFRGLVSEFDEDLLDPQFGSTVSPSPVGTDGEAVRWSGTSLVVDFHGLRSVTGLTIKGTWYGNDASRDCRIQAWAGITWFEPTPASEYEINIPSGDRKTVHFAELEIRKLSLSFSDSKPVEIAEIVLHCRRTVSGLELRVGEESPVWSHREPLAAEIATDNLAAEMNAWLDDQDGEPTEIPLSVTSSGPGLVEISAPSPEVYYVLEEFQGGAPTASFAFDCAKPLSARLRVPVPPDATVDRVRFEAEWQFGANRLCGPEPALGRFGAQASGLRRLAQRLDLPPGSTLSGLDLRVFRRTERVVLALGISTAVRGLPARTAIAETSVTLESPTTSTEPVGSFPTTWACARFDDPIPIEEDEEYWFVLSVAEGSVVWFGSTIESEIHVFFSTDEGASWSAYDASGWTPRRMIRGDVRVWSRSSVPPAALFLGSTPAALVDASSGTRTVLVENPAMEPREITVRAVAFGTVELTNLRIEYRKDAKPAETISHALSAEGLECVHGIGPAYHSRLRDAGIATLSQLAASEPSAAPRVPAVRMVELAAKARTILSVDIDAETFESLLATRLSRIVATPTAGLAASSGLSAAKITRLKDTLGSLQVAMDDQHFKTLTLGEIATPRTHR